VTITAYALAAVTILVSVVAGVFYVLTTWHRFRAERAQARRDEVEAAAAAGLAQARAEAEARRLAAEARKAENEADVFSLVAGNQVFVRDRDRTADWKPLHLNPQHRINGAPGEPTPLEVAAWQLYHGPKSVPAALLPPETEPVELPRRVNLLDLLPLEGATLGHLVLGVAAGPEGDVRPLSAPLGRLVHIGIGGSSGWGKSVFMQAIAYQLAAAADFAVELILVDSELTTFAPFAGCKRLRYPVIDDETDALAVIQDLGGEMSRRKGLFARFSPIPATLTDYNRLADSPLPFVILMIDESTALLDNKAIEAALRPIILKARKYGLFAILGGQDWKASSVSTTIRNQFCTRVHFKALDETQSRVLLRHPDAAHINTPGRGYAIIPGREIVEFQAPRIAAAAIIAAVGERQPAAAPQPLPAAPEPTPREQIILDLWDEGASFNQISKRINEGRTGGTYNDEIKGILKKFGVSG
jgi:DNA segregation ATPase FtsK/SpoIIIE-like protein